MEKGGPCVFSWCQLDSLNKLRVPKGKPGGECLVLMSDEGLGVEKERAWNCRVGV